MSPVLQPDTSAAEDFSQPIPPGTYRAIIVDLDVRKSKAGNQMVVPKFKVNVDGHERTRQSYLVISGEGSMGFDQLLRAVHMNELADAYRDPAVKPKPPFDTDTLRQQELQVVIEPNIYKDESKPVGQQDVLRDQITGYLRA